MMGLEPLRYPAALTAEERQLLDGYRLLPPKFQQALRLYAGLTRQQQQVLARGMVFFSSGSEPGHPKRLEHQHRTAAIARIAA